jgi:hypothetical protein
MAAQKSFFNRLPIPTDKRLLPEVEKALKGFVAGIIAVVEKYALRFHRGAEIAVGVYAECKPEQYGEFRVTTWKKMHTGPLMEGVLALMDVVRATSEKGNREIRVTVDIIDRKEAKKNGAV